MRQRFFWFVMVVGMLSCTKENTTIVSVNDPLPGPDEIPEIEWVGLSATTLKAGVDSLAFTIRYTDGDGDLGTEDPDIPSIELVDQRDPTTLVFNYHVPPLAPPGAEIALTGTLKIVLDHTILLDENHTSETTTYTLRLKDRAGNWSNTLESETVTIVK